MRADIYFSPSAMAPKADPSIVRQLKEHDPLLDVEWNPRTCRWVVTGPNLLNPNKREHIMTVQGEEGVFQPLDQRTVVNIKLADAYRYNDEQHFNKLVAHNNHALDQRQKDELSNKFRARNEELYRAKFGYKSVAPRGGWRLG